MKKNIFCTALLLMSTAAVAEYKSPKLFSYTGVVDKVGHVSWQPNGAVLNEGFHISFFGSTDPAAGCPKDLLNGAVVSDLFWANMLDDTGLDLINWNHQWSPASDSRCALQNWQGYSHAHIKNVNQGGGIGMYTHTGPKPDNPSMAFFQPYTAEADQHGVNAHIQGTFASFRNTPYTKEQKVTKPFSGNSTNDDLRRTAIRSYQGIGKFMMENPATQQIRQQFYITFFNKRCHFENTYSKKSCHIQVLFESVAKGLNAELDYANIFSDAAQGGLVAISGDLKSAGGITYGRDSAGNQYPLWTSWGNPSQSNPWSGQIWFQPEVSFNQFKNLVRLSTAELAGIHNATQVTNTDMNRYFGPAFENPDEWILLDVGIGQEVYNSTTDKRAVIGGNMTELSVIALPY